MSSIVTPVEVDKLQELLEISEYDKQESEFLIEGFTKGFSIGYQGPTDVRILTKNHKLRAGNQTILWNKLMNEVKLKRAAGPWRLENLPFRHFIQSPITLIPKKGSEDKPGPQGT